MKDGECRFRAATSRAVHEAGSRFVLIAALLVPLPAASYQYPDLDRISLTGTRVGGPVPSTSWRNRPFETSYDGGDGGGDYYATGTDDETEDADSEEENRCDNPVDIVTGKKYQSIVDFAVESNPGLSFVRTYNAAWVGAGILGPRWITNHDLKLSFDTVYFSPGTATCYPDPARAPCSVSAPTNIFAHRNEGNAVRFTWNASANAWLASEEAPGARIVRAGANFELRWQDGGIERYAGNGFILQRLGRDGIGLTYTYDASHRLTTITHTSGRRITFAHQSGRLTEVRDPAGNAYVFGYGTTVGNWLNEVRYPDSKANALYHYEAGNLTGFSIDGVRRTYYAYDSAQRVMESKKADGTDRKTYAYFSDRAERTNALGRKTTYKKVGGRITEITGHASSQCPATFAKREFDAEGRLDKVTNENGVITDFDYDTDGRLVRRIEALGTPVARTMQIAWNEGLRTRETLPGLSETRYSYTADGRLAGTTLVNLSPNGVQGQTRSTTYAYQLHANGIPATVVVDGPLAGAGDAVTYRYSAQGDLLSTANSLAHTTTFDAYDAMGRVGRVTDPNGDAQVLQHDARGRLILSRRFIEGAAHDTRHTYDGAGLRATTTTPDGVTRQFVYDVAQRLVGEFEQKADGRFDAKRYTYNAESQLASVSTERVDSHPFPIYGAKFISQSVPASMVAGQTYSVSVHLRNEGNAPWRARDAYRLGVRNPGVSWVPNGRVYLTKDVAPGETATFAFTVTAPRSATSLNFQWRMVRDGFLWFGDMTPNVTIGPTFSYGATLVDYTAPPHMLVGESASITVRVRNTGTHAWNVAGEPTLVLARNNASYAMPDKTYAPGAVAPGQIATLRYNFVAPPGPGSPMPRYSFGGALWLENVQSLLTLPVKTTTVENPAGECTGSVCQNPY